LKHNEISARVALEILFWQQSADSVFVAQRYAGRDHAAVEARLQEIRSYADLSKSTDGSF
jgi:hypothetical protein